MNLVPVIRILLLEDNPTDVLLMREAFQRLTTAEYRITHLERLAHGLEHLARELVDAVLLDLALPDSRGVETFLRLHRLHPSVPVLVLTALDDEVAGIQAVQSGAQDYLVKPQISSALLGRSIRYAIERVRLQRALQDSRDRELHEREMRQMSRYSSSPTEVTARLYSGGSLRENLPEEFGAAVEEYAAVLDRSLEQRVLRVDYRCGEDLRGLGDRLGFWRCSPRDVIEIHIAALRRRTANAPAAKAHAYAEEARLALIELMGNLTGYYRNYYLGPVQQDSTP